MKAVVCRPEVDSSILIHRDPRTWEELLGWRCIEAFMRNVGFLGVREYSLVDIFFEYPEDSPNLLLGALTGGVSGLHTSPP